MKKPQDTPPASAGLNGEQRAAAEYEGRNLLVLAGAGSGKTRTIIARAKYLLEHGTPPERVLILSFTKKSAKEIVNRLRSGSQQDLSQLRGLTFHSWCMELIERNPQVFNFGRFSVLDEEDTESAFKLIGGRNFKLSNFIKPKQLAEVYSYAVNTRCNLTTALRKRLFNGQMDDKTKEKILKKLPVYQEVISKYLAFKKEHRYLDYDDLLMRVATGLGRNPQAAEFIAGAYDHILIDEMQDTNPLQYHLLESFWSRCNLFCVGDDAQSIYGFRGADFQSIHHFADMVPETDIQKLTLNYRSTQEILDLSNWVLACSPLHYNKKLVAARGHGDKPMLIHYNNEWDQARDIVMRIKDSQGAQGMKFEDNMVLSRTNFSLRSIEGCLLEAQIPYEIFGGMSLLKSRHIRDLVSALRIVANPRDELAWVRFLTLFPGIGEITATKVIDKLLEKNNLAECLELLDKLPTVPPSAIEALRRVAEAETQVGVAIERALNALESVFASRYKDDWDRRRRDFTVLQKIGADSEGLTAFIANYVLDPSLAAADKQEAEPKDHVVLSTIHSAKGLEAANVYLVNASYNQYPSPSSVAQGDDAIEEDRRCLYVALTRAKDHLYVYRSVASIDVAEVEETSGVAYSRLYFLNNVPPELYSLEYLGDESRRWRQYRGEGISFDSSTDFDFS